MPLEAQSRSAPTLPQLFAAAYERHPSLAQLDLELGNAQLELRRAAAARGVELALSGGADGDLAAVTYTFPAGGGVSAPEVVVGARLAGELPDPWGSLWTTVPVTVLDATGAGVSVGVVSGFSQSLDPLIGRSSTAADDLLRQHAVRRAERALRAGKREVAGDLLAVLRRLYELQIEDLRNRHRSSLLEDELGRRRTLFRENEETHSFQQLLFEIERLARAGAVVAARRDLEIAQLRRLTGMELLPDDLRPPRLQAPAAAAPDRGAALDAAVALQVAELRERDHRRRRWPSFTVGGSYDWIAAELEATIGVSVTLLDSGSHRLAAAQLRNDREAAGLALAQAHGAVAAELARAAVDVRDLTDRGWALEQRRRLAALQVAEARAAFAAGFTNAASLGEVELEAEVLEVEARILDVDRWSQHLRLEALNDGG